MNNASEECLSITMKVCTDSLSPSLHISTFNNSALKPKRELTDYSVQWVFTTSGARHFGHDHQGQFLAGQSTLTWDVVFAMCFGRIKCQQLATII